MHKVYLTLLAAMLHWQAPAQTIAELQETARSFQRTGDYDNAILVLKKAILQAPDDALVKMDLATNLFLARQYRAAADILNPLVERPDADEQVFQMACLVQRGLLDFKETDRLYKLALKKFPRSGLLHAEYGDLLEAKDPGLGKGIVFWEKGIELDPTYPGNYYYAAKYHNGGTGQVWSLLYGEIFVNLESYTARTTEIKNLLLAGYKRIYIGGMQNLKGKNAFENAVIAEWRQSENMASSGIDPELLTAIRTRFVLGWFANDKAMPKYAFRLFSHHQELLKQGFFNAYNQWLFGPAANMSAYQTWTTNHPAEQTEFTKYQRNRLFKVPTGEYYNK
ncbi:MAG: tetratricopeptide repeat protein [Bacteroidetes bacterium]|nr:MAG: tetratricopeptide repeat protein [Bacteroidota bacterium]